MDTVMDDTPPVAHISSDNEDEESTKNPSVKGSEARQRGPPKKLSREARAACRTYASLGVPHKLLGARYNCSTHMVSRVVNNSFRIPDNVESDDEHFDVSEDKDQPKEFESFFDLISQRPGEPHKKEKTKTEKKQPIKLVVRGQSSAEAASASTARRASATPAWSLPPTNTSEPSSPVKDRPETTSPLSKPQEIAVQSASTAHPIATPLAQLGVKRKRDEVSAHWQTSPPVDDHVYGEKQQRLNGSHLRPLGAPPSTSISSPLVQPSPRQVREAPKPQLNGRIEELERTASSNFPRHQSEGTPSSASVSRYTLVPTTAEDFLLPPEPKHAAGQVAQNGDGDDVEDPMDEDEPALPVSLTQLISQAQALGQVQRQRRQQPQQQTSWDSVASRRGILTPTPALAPVPAPAHPLSEVEAFLKSLKPDLSSLLPTFYELGIQSTEYLDGLRSIPRAENKEWFDELTSKGHFTPFQAHVILRALYN